MRLTPDEIALLRERRDGWRPLRDRLWVALVERLRIRVLDGPTSDLSRCRVRMRFRGLLQDAHDAEDFISEFAAERIRRIDAGTLLNEFDPDRETDLCDYLAAASFVRNRAKDHQARCGRRHEVVLESAADKPDGGRDNGGTIDPIGELVGRLRMPPPNPAGIGALHRHAAMQTYPWQVDQDGFDPYQKDLAAKVAPLGDRGPLEHLADRHAAAAAGVAERRKRLERELIEHPNRTTEVRHRIESRMAKATVKAIIAPLAAEAVQSLLTLPSAAAARQQISRYRRDLSRVFPRVAGLERHLHDDGEEGLP